MAEVVAEGNAAIIAERSVRAENIKWEKRVFVLEKREPGLYFDGLATVAAFEEKIANLETEKALLASEKFGIIGDLARAMQELRIAKAVGGSVGIRALVAASERSDTVEEAQ